MAITIDLSIILSVCSVVAVCVSAILTFGKLKWEHELYRSDIDKAKTDINNLGKKVDSVSKDIANEQQVLLKRIDMLDKTILVVSTKLDLLVDTVNDIKNRLNSDD